MPSGRVKVGWVAVPVWFASSAVDEGEVIPAEEDEVVEVGGALVFPPRR